MNHSCQPKVLVDNILCIAMKLSVLPSKVTVVTPMVFKMVENGTQSNFITTAFISGGLGNAFFFQELQSGGLLGKIMFQCMLDVSRKLLWTKSLAARSTSKCLPVAIFIAQYLFNGFICFVHFKLTDS